MLIQTAINLLSPTLEALAWVERFGGVVRRIDMPIQTENGTEYRSYPISCSVTESDCNNNQFYQDLTPDSRKKSLLYWEVLQALTDTGEFRGLERKRVMTGRARLVGWLNTDKLGVAECNSAAKAMRSILPIVNTTFKDFATGSEFANSTVKFQFASEEIKDSAIFSRYDYGQNKDGFLLHPFDFFAINVDITINLSLCNFTFETGDAIPCTSNAALL